VIAIEGDEIEWKLFPDETDPRFGTATVRLKLIEGR
jgi:hypothetical protein